MYYFRTKAWTTGEAATPDYRAKAHTHHLEVRSFESNRLSVPVHCTLVGLGFTEDIMQKQGVLL